ncbi:YfbM family protein [Brevibacillus sp. NPDC003359]|uniref:YfbM family protein n=1 Tax=unclassified Brevibacillus TaxID=2684853 RepID=UPI00369CDEC0
MGMCGNYLIANDEMIDAWMAGNIDLYEVDLIEQDTLDIDKTWQAIPYTLCGELMDGEPPFCYVVPLLTDQAVEFGEFGAFYLHSDQVKAAHEAIANMTESALKEKYNFSTLMENDVYPLHEGDEAEGFFTYMYHHFQSIQAFFKRAVAQEKGLIFYIR